MWEVNQDGLVEYRCRVRHTYSAAALKEGQQEALEASLWEALVTLESAADTAEQTSGELGPEGQEEARQKREQANVLRDLLKDVSHGKLPQHPEPSKR
jgi:two-component system, chemotaxis family, protein-glutamate methylesterase/glutaminase